MLQFAVFQRVERLHLVEQYQHLDIWITRTGVQSLEFRHSAQKTLGKFFVDTVPVLKSPWITASRKPVLVNVFTTPCLLSNGQTWGPTSSPQLRILETVLSNMIRYTEKLQKAVVGRPEAVPEHQLYATYAGYSGSRRWGTE